MCYFVCAWEIGSFILHVDACRSLLMGKVYMRDRNLHQKSETFDYRPWNDGEHSHANLIKLLTQMTAKGTTEPLKRWTVHVGRHRCLAAVVLDQYVSTFSPKWTTNGKHGHQSITRKSDENSKYNLIFKRTLKPK